MRLALQWRMTFSYGNANGEGFKICGHQQGDKIKAGEPLIEVNFDRLSKSYNMSTMLIVTNSNEQKIEFLSEENVTRGQKLIA